MKSINKILTSIAAMMLSTLTFAQGKEVEMADGLRSSGKIYVVVAVVVVIFIGLLAYLFASERRLKKLEEELEANKS